MLLFRNVLVLGLAVIITGALIMAFWNPDTSQELSSGIPLASGSEPLLEQNHSPIVTPKSNVISGLDKVDEGDLNSRFVKISGSGAELDSAAREWTCIADRSTSLLWEVKSNDGGWRDAELTYTWYQSATEDKPLETGMQDGGDCLFISCDTEAYLQRAQQDALCGESEWRLPTEDELKSLDHPTRYSPDVHTEFFPFTRSAEYWSGSESEYDNDLAWSVDFANGIGYVSKKSLRKHIRLVSELQKAP